MLEEWRDIKGYEGLYQVSNIGRVRLLDRIVKFKDGRIELRKGRIKTLSEGNRGHLSFQTIIPHKKRIYVHRAMYEAFIGEIPKGYVIHHINHNVKDNRLENLELMEVRLHNKMHGDEKALKTSKKVLQLTKDGKLVKIWNSTQECGKNGFDQSAVSHCCRNAPRYKTHKGFKWQYA